MRQKPAGEPFEVFGQHHRAAKQCRAGTHRTRSPRETFDDYSRLMPAMGITRIANVTGLDHIGLPVFTAIRPNARSLSTSQGKGVDPDAARVSALMESIEFWHAEQRDMALRNISYTELLRRGERATNLELLPRARAGGRVRPDAIRPWIEGHDLVSGEPTWVPFEIMSMGTYQTSRSSEFGATTNGLSSGNHLLESIVHGLCEVIERDADTLWGYSPTLNSVDPASVTDPECKAILRLLDDAGIFVAIFDLTSDVGVPAYRTVIVEPPERLRVRPVALGDGYGAHLSPGVALSRALTESIQSRLTYIAGSRDDFSRTLYDRVTGGRYQLALLDQVRGFQFDGSFTSRSDLSNDSFEEDLRLLLEKLKNVGLESAVAVNLTRPELGIPVTFVVVPGLEGYSSSHRPGRRVESKYGAL